MMPATRPRMTPPSAEQALSSLARTYGAQAGHLFWEEACRRAGLPPRDVVALPALLKVADAMASLGGPISASGVALIIRIRAFQAMEARAAQESR